MSTNSSQILTSAIVNLSIATELYEITQIVAGAARGIAKADGTTFVLREQDKCYYADEDAISPLWKGKRFPMEACISGWSMLHKKIVNIRDIYQDERIPHDAYRPTFVKSLCMTPIRAENPIGAIGSYWKTEYTPTEHEVRMLQVLADTTSVALENLELKKSAQVQFLESSTLRDRTKELEVAMYSLAHDLRSPVSVMTGIGEILKNQSKNLSKEELAENIQCIIDTGRRTAMQIDRILSLYRATSGKLMKDRVDITDYTNKIMGGYKFMFPSRTIECLVEPNLSTYADPSLIYMVLENLLSNAVKYSSMKPNTLIHVGSRTGVEGYNTFYVQDNGNGFSQSQVPNLFKPLGRLPNNNDLPGTGLGLASVARIIDLHGGKVGAEGQEMKGATFFFSLPQVAS